MRMCIATHACKHHSATCIGGAPTVQAGDSLVLNNLRQTGKTALKAAKRKVIMKENKNRIRKNLGLAEKKLKKKNETWNEGDVTEFI